MCLFALAHDGAHWKTGTRAQKNLLLISKQPQHHQIRGWMFSSPLLVSDFLS